MYIYFTLNLNNIKKSCKIFIYNICDALIIFDLSNIKYLKCIIIFSTINKIMNYKANNRE